MLFTIAMMVCWIDDLPTERLDYIKSLTPGEIIAIGEPNQKNVLGSDNFITHLRLVELLTASDEVGINELLTKKRVVIFTGGTSAKVIKRGKDYIEVRVQDGEHKGSAWYVHFTWICKPPKK